MPSSKLPVLNKNANLSPVPSLALKSRSSNQSFLHSFMMTSPNKLEKRREIVCLLKTQETVKNNLSDKFKIKTDSLKKD
jgi:hypothetical protein